MRQDLLQMILVIGKTILSNAFGEKKDRKDNFLSIYGKRKMHFYKYRLNMVEEVFKKIKSTHKQIISYQFLLV